MESLDEILTKVHLSQKLVLQYYSINMQINVSIVYSTLVYKENE